MRPKDNDTLAQSSGVNEEARKTSSKGRIRTIAATSAFAVVAVLSILFKNQVRDLFTAAKLESIYSASDRYPLAVYFYDSGSAGCTLIHTSGGDVLIDSGREKAQNNVCDLLSFLGANTLELAVLTHPDSDHIGNFSEVIEEYGADRFLTCAYSESCKSPLYVELSETLRLYDIPIEYASPGDSFSIGGAKLEVISPLKTYKASNDNSVVIRLDYGEFSALFTGDISKKVEKDILESGRNIDCDLLLAAHHGSGGSSSEEFLEAVSPEYAVIEVEESLYLPHGDAIDRLAACSCEIYRTDVSGTVAVFSDGTSGGTVVMEEFE